MIPFRGLIREVSGAKDHELQVRAAIQAGFARRGFLKGVGQARGCAYPARPAARRDVAQFMAGEKSGEPDREAQGQAKPAEPQSRPVRPRVRYTSRAVVQPVK